MPLDLLLLRRALRLIVLIAGLHTGTRQHSLTGRWSPSPDHLLWLLAQYHLLLDLGIHALNTSRLNDILNWIVVLLRLSIDLWLVLALYKTETLNVDGLCPELVDGGEVLCIGAAWRLDRLHGGHLNNVARADRLDYVHWVADWHVD